MNTRTSEPASGRRTGRLGADLDLQVVDDVAHGVEVFDLCRGDAPYKRRWTNGERHLATLTLTRPGIRGSLARAWLRVAGALARRLRTRTRSSSDESSAT